LHIATVQLTSAIGLFVSNRDRLSAITLAGAADAILHAMVLKAGKEPFVDYMVKIEEAKSGTTPPRGKMATHINNELGINALKHLNEDDADHIEIDIDQCALGAIAKAIANYKQVVDHEPDFIKAFYGWTWQNLDGKKMMEAYENRPENVRKFT